MKSAPKQPTPADPGRTAATQSGMNLNTAVAQSVMNNVDQVTPYGNLTYSRSDEKVWQPAQYDSKGKQIKGTGQYIKVPKWTANQQLTRDGQEIFDSSMATGKNLSNIAEEQSGRIGSMMRTPMNFDGITGRAGAVEGPSLRGGVKDDMSGERARVEATMLERVSPQLAAAREAKRAELMSRGIREGSEAWRAAIDDVNRSENDMRLAVVGRAGDEMARDFGMAAQNNQMFDAAEMQRYGAALTAADRQNADRSAGIQERMTLRSQPFNEISALLSGAQLQQPNFVNTPQTGLAGVDYSGLVTNRDNMLQRQYEQQMAQRNSMIGGLFGLAAAPFMYSDRRLKRDVEQIGAYPSGLPIYRYRYVWSDKWQIGVMADEAPAHAVREIGGFLAVNYGGLR